MGQTPLCGLRYRSGLRRCCHVHSVLVQRTFLAKRHIAVYQSEQSVVFAHTHVIAWVELGATLANDDRASSDKFTAESFYTEHLGV